MHARVADGIKRARGARSAQWLADRTSELGSPITRAQIANYESGRKKSLDIAELVVIAAALDVPAITLLYPDLPDADVEVLPGQHVSSIVAMLRFSGELDRTPTSDLGRLAMLSRRRFQRQIHHQAAVAFLDKLAEENPEEFTADRVLSVADELDELREVNRQIREIPGAVVDDA